jgi:hypothetical protein
MFPDEQEERGIAGARRIEAAGPVTTVAVRIKLAVGKEARTLQDGKDDDVLPVALNKGALLIEDKVFLA